MKGEKEEKTKLSQRHERERGIKEIIAKTHEYT